MPFKQRQEFEVREVALCEGISVEEGPEEASLEAEGGCCRTPGSRGCRLELGAARDKVVGKL